MTTYPFFPQIALDINGDLVTSGAGQIYALDDTSFTTPLSLTDESGGALASVSVSALGATQFFQVADHYEVWWKSGSLPAVALASWRGLVTTAEAAQTAADAAQAAAEGAEAFIGDTVDGQVDAIVSDAGTATRATLDGLYAGKSEIVALATANGAVPDGTTDNAAAIQAAIDALTALGGGVLLFTVTADGDTYRIDSTINLKSNVTLRGDGAATIDYSNVPLSGSARYGIRATGTVGTSTLLTANTVRGDTSVAVTSAAGLAAGGWAMLGTTGSNYYAYNGGVNVDRGEIKKVKSVASLTVGFEQVAYDAYATANAAFLAPIAMVENVAVERLRIVGTGSAASGDRAIQLDYVDGFRIVDNVIEATEVYAVQLSGAIRGEVSGNRIRGVYYDGAIGQVFYAVSVMNASQWVRVENNHAEQVRHLFVTSANSAGQGYWGMPRFITCVGNVAQNMEVVGTGRSWAYEHHGFGDAILIANNVADGCYGGFCARGPGVTFTGNIVRNWYQHAIEIHNDIVDARNILVTNNQVSHRFAGATDPVAILIDLTNATTVRGVLVADNVVEVDSTGTVPGALHALGSVAAGLTIRGNRFTWVGASAPSSWLGRIYPPMTEVLGNHFLNTLYGVRIYGADCDVCENVGHHASQQVSGQLVYVDASGCTVNGNRSRNLRYCVQSSASGTALTLIGNVAVSSSADPFAAGTSTGLVAKVNVWQGGTTAINT